jgi:RNA polymerase sigma-70 factor (ECF subfamily)
VRRNNRLLFRTARGVVPDDAEAQDVVQETYLRAFTNLRAYRGDAKLSTWLARIAINVAVNSQRKRGRVVQLQESGNFADQDTVEHAMPLHAQHDEAPDAVAERKEVRALLQASIEDLPVIYRSVFILRAVQDLSVEETSYCLGVSEDVVKTRFLRARAMLRDKLAARVENCAQDTFSFAGPRCDGVLARVMSQLLAQGLIRGQ